MGTNLCFGELVLCDSPGDGGLVVRLRQQLSHRLELGLERSLLPLELHQVLSHASRDGYLGFGLVQLRSQRPVTIRKQVYPA